MVVIGRIGVRAITVRGNFGGDPVINSLIANLVSHLATKDLTEDQICEFLTTKTLTFLDVGHVWISEVTNRKTIRARASYGIDQSKFADWQEFPLDWKLPVTDALVEQKLVWINGLPEWPNEYPLLKNVAYEKNMRTQIIIPIIRFDSPVACLGLVSHSELNPDEELDIFFRTLADLISLHLFRQARDRKRLESPNVSSLSDRQVQILVHIADKKTNLEIADLMGYSESTIRQETIRIFEKLNVKGRNEARTFFLQNKERFGITARAKGDLPSSREEFAH